jgi:sugar O-acyltransferase (sialic acid O-acetyltransferase NeuD family)
MSTRIPLYVFGAGGHGKVVAEAARASGEFEVRGFLDDDRALWSREWAGLPVLGGREALRLLGEDARVALGLGGNRARAELLGAVRAEGRPLATVVHPSAILASGVRVGEGTYVGPLALLHTDVEAGLGCILNSACVLEHDCRLGDFVQVSPRGALGGGARVDEGAHVGIGAVVLPGLSIGAWSTLGAGAVLTRSLPCGLIATGIPARGRLALEKAG